MAVASSVISRASSVKEEVQIMVVVNSKTKAIRVLKVIESFNKYFVTPKCAYFDEDVSE